MGLFSRKPEKGESSQHGDYKNGTAKLSSKSEFTAARNAMVGGEFHLAEAEKAEDGDAKSPGTRQYHERHASANFEAAQRCFDSNRDQILEEGKNRDNNDRRLPGSPW